MGLLKVGHSFLRCTAYRSWCEAWGLGRVISAEADTDSIIPSINIHQPHIGFVAYSRETKKVVTSRLSRPVRME